MRGAPAENPRGITGFSLGNGRGRQIGKDPTGLIELRDTVGSVREGFFSIYLNRVFLKFFSKTRF